VLNSVAWAFATSTDNAVRNPESALRYARRAIAEDKEGPKPHILDTLAEAYFVNEQYSEAVRTEQQAIAAATAEEKDRYQENLEKYQRAVKGDRPQRPAAIKD
jgi:tetratricopeptide (TPR) repeat protein